VITEVKGQSLGDVESASRSFFDDWAKKYGFRRLTRWFRYTQRLAIGSLQLRPDSRVLDIGCGTGYATWQLASLVPEGSAFGVDISLEMIRRACRQVPKDLAQRTHFSQATVTRLPFVANVFTHALCTNSFHHYPKPVETLKEIKRVLVPGGQLAILENARELSMYVRAWDVLLKLVEKGHAGYHSSQELGQMIEKAGLDNAELCLLKKGFFFRYNKVFASIQLWRSNKPK